ncbi:MAG: VWA domain-containing protein [Acidobacteriaceae bacterium]|nr:VWA domain-containing protein [Acidobacteriaceae bacterium]
MTHFYSWILNGVFQYLEEHKPLMKFSAPIPVVLLCFAFMTAFSLTQNTVPATASQTIHLFVTVHDKHGKPASTLSKSDFVLTQDDHSQAIEALSLDADLPLTVGLIFDTGMNQAGALDRERSASHDFLDQMLRENKDRAFIIHFNREVELLQDLTNSRDKLFNALGLLQAARPQFDDSSDSGESGEGRRGRRGSVLYDAIFLACDELMKTQQGRKVLIVMSDGVDRNSKETVGSAIESAQRTNTLVYNAFSKAEEIAPSEHRGFGFPRGGGMGRPPGGGQRRAPEETPADAKKIVEQVSRETGGGFFELSKKDSMDQIARIISDDLRHQYEITYRPQQSGDWSGFHKISLTTTQKDFAVQAPSGFYAGR